MTAERRPRPYLGGEWFAGPTPSYLDGRQSASGHGSTATVWTYLLPTRANARLILAAPRLVDALEDLLNGDDPAAKSRAQKLLELVLSPIDEQKPPQRPHTDVVQFFGTNVTGQSSMFFATPLDAGMIRDALRYRWLRAGNAYRPEEEDVTGDERLDALTDGWIIWDAIFIALGGSFDDGFIRGWTTT
jgi:hypothetical protein